MAELDLYGDLYGDVDECGSPVALSPSQPTATTDDHHASSAATTGDQAKSSASHREDVVTANQPTTFSISTYEETPYSHKQHEPSHHHLAPDGWSDSSHVPRSASTVTDSTHVAGGMGGRPGLWGVKPSDMPDEGKMFVGGLNWETTEDALKQYFSQYGAVVHCTIMRDPTNGRSRGFAFLTFADPAVVNKVMVKEHFLDGKLIDPKRAIPRGSGPGPSGLGGPPMGEKRIGHHFGSETSASLSNKLFCRGMPEDATPQSFRTYWARFNSKANIEEAILMMDRESNRHRGFGFVNLVTSEDADALLKCGPFVMDGHPLEVKRKAPSRARYDSRDDSTSKIPSAPLDRYGHPYAAPPHPAPSMFHPNPMGGYFKGGLAGPNWKGWNPGMLPPMGGVPNRPMYMGGMGMPPDGRGMGPTRSMVHDGPTGMGYGGGFSRHSAGGYGQDWRTGPTSGMRSSGPYPTSYHQHHPHSGSPPSMGAVRTQRSSRNYAPY